jgi:hypothetical protein
LNRSQRLASAAKMRDMLRDSKINEGVAAKAQSPFARTEINQPGGPAALPGASTHLLASAPATSSQPSDKTGSYTTRASATNMRGAAPARFNEKSLNRARPGTAAQRRSATAEIADTGASNLSKVIAAGAILVVAVALIAFVFTRGLKRDDASAAPISVQKSEPVTGSDPSGSSAKTAVEDPVSSTSGAPPVAPTSPSAKEEPRPNSDDSHKEKEAAVGQEAKPEEPKPEEPNRARAGVPSMQEPEGTKPIQRKPEEAVREEPRSQEPAPRQEPYPRQEPPSHYPPPPDQLPPPHPYPPPPGGMPPPGRRRP